MRADQFAYGVLYRLADEVERDSFTDEKDAIADTFREIQVENFVGEVDDFDTPWAPRKQNYAHPTLRKSLEMFEAATAKGKTGNVQRDEPDKLILGVDDSQVPYAKYQQRGTKKKDGSTLIPARKFVHVAQRKRARFKPHLRLGLLRILLASSKRAARS